MNFDEVHVSNIKYWIAAKSSKLFVLRFAQQIYLFPFVFSRNVWRRRREGGSKLVGVVNMQIGAIYFELLLH